MTPTPSCVDPRALREQLSLAEVADVCSSDFLRFIVRLSEALDRDIPRDDYQDLVTLHGCFEYVRRHAEAMP
jgi:hypothetical protein